MTDQELRSAILADAAAKALASSGDDAGCAARLIATLPHAVVSTYVDERGIVAAFANPADGQAAMQGFEAAAASNPLWQRALKWLAPSNGGIDFGNPGTRAVLDQLQQSGTLSATAVVTLRALAERPAAVTVADVSRALAPDRPNGKVTPLP